MTLQDGLKRTQSGQLGKAAATRVAAEQPWILTPRKVQGKPAAQDPRPVLARANSSDLGREAARRVMHFSRRAEQPVAKQSATSPELPNFQHAEVQSSSSCKFLQDEEAKAAAMSSQMEQIEHGSLATVKSLETPPSAEALEHERIVEKTNALVSEAEQARAEAAAKFSGAKFWEEPTDDPNAYDPTSHAEQLRRLNEHRAFLAEQRDKNLRSLQEGKSPVLARQQSEQLKAESQEAKREEWRQKEKAKTDALVEELAAVDAKIERLRANK